MNNLIVGGTSGLGLELARNMAAADEPVIISGRHDPLVGFAEYRHLDLGTGNLPDRIGEFVANLPPIKSLIYAAGFYQDGHITDLSDEDVDTMIDVGGRGLIFSVKKLLEKQGKVDELVTITSTSQWTPREYEPVYNFVKAGAGHYSHGQALDPRISKTIVVGTSGMATEFWNGTGKDASSMMRPQWVAGQVMELRKRTDKYTFAKILGATADLPQRVEIDEPALTSQQTVGNKIKEQRARLGLGAAEAAELVGVSRFYLACIEKGVSPRQNKEKEWRPSRKVIMAAAEALKMDPNTLLIDAGYAPIE